MAAQQGIRERKDDIYNLTFLFILISWVFFLFSTCPLSSENFSQLNAFAIFAELDKKGLFVK
jgi:hypothetical protein